MAALRAYLDHNATTPLRPAAGEAMMHAMTTHGNPSSIHAEGRAARAMIDAARSAVAKSVGGEARNVIFTSGATEALNTLLAPSPALVSLSGAKTTTRLLVLATEHSAALAGGRFPRDCVETIPVDGDGIADIVWLENRLLALKDKSGFSSVTVAVQLANSETGVIQPVTLISELTDRYGALLICDCVAAFGKLEINLAELNVDAIVVSAHKFGGPKGVGAIILHGDTLQLQEPLLRGGGQEMRRRSGTENVAAIAGMGIAATEAITNLISESARMVAMRDNLIVALKAVRPDLVVFGEKAPRLPNTLDFAVPGMRAETAVINFDLAGVAISSGSACSSGKVKQSHVLEAMGVNDELAACALRFSLGWTTTEEDIELAVAAFTKLAKQGLERQGQRHVIAA